jgi:hypothetical protein
LFSPPAVGVNYGFYRLAGPRSRSVVTNYCVIFTFGSFF